MGHDAQCVHTTCAHALAKRPSSGLDSSTCAWAHSCVHTVHAYDMLACASRTHTHTHGVARTQHARPTHLLLHAAPAAPRGRVLAVAVAAHVRHTRTHAQHAHAHLLLHAAPAAPRRGRVSRVAVPAHVRQVLHDELAGLGLAGARLTADLRRKPMGAAVWSSLSAHAFGHHEVRVRVQGQVRLRACRRAQARGGVHGGPMGAVVRGAKLLPRAHASVHAHGGWPRTRMDCPFHSLHICRYAASAIA